MAWRSQGRKYLSYRESRSFRRKLFKLIGLGLLAFLLYEALSALVFTRRIDSQSMQPNLRRGDLVLGSPVVYNVKLPFMETGLIRFSEPRRGDVVLMKIPFAPDQSIFERMLDPVARFISLQSLRVSFESREGWQNEFAARRIIGLPGDTLKIEKYEAFLKPGDSQNFISEHALAFTRYDVQAAALPQGWDDPTIPFSGGMPEISLGPDQYFVLADNRSAGLDSRHWGPISEAAIAAKVLLRYWPLSRAEGR
jgi:signal peptidase I